MCDFKLAQPVCFERDDLQVMIDEMFPSRTTGDGLRDKVVCIMIPVCTAKATASFATLML